LKILLYSINYSPELTGIGKDNGKLVEELIKLGNTVNVITAPPYYPQWQIDPLFKNRWNKYSIKNLTVFRSPIYVTSKLSPLKRLIHLFHFH
jgi:colanic acid biosynthesis glycosyl transferase WcaI